MGTVLVVCNYAECIDNVNGLRCGNENVCIGSVKCPVENEDKPLWWKNDK